LYLAPRGDGQAGTGTITDPFDASTPAKLWQAWLKTAFRSDGLTNHTIVFLPGTYACTNDLRLPWDAREVIISGYGARLVEVDTALEGQRHMLTTSWEGNDAVSFEGFSLDCGSAVKYGASAKVCGVWSRGKGNSVRNVTVKNLASCNRGGDSLEAFGINLVSDGGIVSGCQVSGIAGELPFATGICLNGSDSVASGNVVDLGDTSATNQTVTFGYSLYGNRLLLSGNVARNVDAGISMDGSGDGGESTWSDNVVTGNILGGNEMCVRIDNNTQGYRNWLWTGNNFHANGGRWLLLSTQNPKWAATKIAGNRFTGNAFSGTVQADNLLLSNWGEDPHTFNANSFSVPPKIQPLSNEKDLYGQGNTVQGRPANREFRGE